MDRWKGQLAVVTGASGGIGAAITKRLIQEGLVVCGLARRKDRIENLVTPFENQQYASQLRARAVDLTQEKEVKDTFRWIDETLGAISILINCAGVFYFGDSLVDGDAGLWQNTFDTNVIGTCLATREAVKSMKKHKVDGHIVNMNSIVGHKVPSFYTGLSAYPASKHAVTALTETLRVELLKEKSRIKITSLSPGAVNTSMMDGIKREYNMSPHAANSKFLSVDDVTSALLYVLGTPRNVCVRELIVQHVDEKY